MTKESTKQFLARVMAETNKAFNAGRAAAVRFKQKPQAGKSVLAVKRGSVQHGGTGWPTQQLRLATHVRIYRKAP